MSEQRHSEEAPAGAFSCERFQAKAWEWFNAHRTQLAKLFPPDNPLSPWMYRLAIIRDDVSFEVAGLGVQENDGLEEVWRCTYFIRKLCITIFEAAGLFEQEVQTHGNRQRAESPKLHSLISRAREAVVAVREVIEPVRNGLGAHIRPAYVAPDRDKSLPSVEETLFRNHGNHPASVTLDFRNSQRTSFRGATFLAPLMAWPDIEDWNATLEKHLELRHAIMAGARSMVGSIEIILAEWRNELGIIKIPDGHALTIPKRWPFNVEDLESPPAMRKGRK